MEQVNKEYKRGFNLGYEIAKELNLTEPLIVSDSEQPASNPINAGMTQFIKENSIAQTLGKTQSSSLKKVQNKNMGKGLGL